MPSGVLTLCHMWLSLSSFHLLYYVSNSTRVVRGRSCRPSQPSMCLQCSESSPDSFTLLPGAICYYMGSDNHLLAIASSLRWGLH